MYSTVLCVLASSDPVLEVGGIHWYCGARYGFDPFMGFSHTRCGYGFELGVLVDFAEKKAYFGVAVSRGQGYRVYRSAEEVFDAIPVEIERTPDGYKVRCSCGYQIRESWLRQCDAIYRHYVRHHLRYKPSRVTKYALFTTMFNIIYHCMRHGSKG